MLKHNHAWTNETNPDGKLFLCKHLYRAINDVFDHDKFEKLIGVDQAKSSEQNKLRKQIVPPNKEEPKEEPKKKQPEEEKPVKNIKNAEVAEPNEEPKKPVNDVDVAEPEVKPTTPEKKKQIPVKLDVQKQIAQLPGRGRAAAIKDKQPLDVEKDIDNLDKSEFEKNYDEQEEEEEQEE